MSCRCHRRVPCRAWRSWRCRAKHVGPRGRPVRPAARNRHRSGARADCPVGDQNTGSLDQIGNDLLFPAGQPTVTTMSSSWNAELSITGRSLYHVPGKEGVSRQMEHYGVACHCGPLFLLTLIPERIVDKIIRAGLINDRVTPKRLHAVSRHPGTAGVLSGLRDAVGLPRNDARGSRICGAVRPLRLSPSWSV